MLIFADGWSEGYDGPGRRWVLYLKGCNLRCRWCASPESIESRQQMLFYPERGSAPDKACPLHAVTGSSGTWSLDRTKCENCETRDCVTIFKHPAFEAAGSEMDLPSFTREIQRRRPLFSSGGGVTFTGGEATLQADAVLEALNLLRNESIHSAIETNASTRDFSRFIGRADLLICDLKCVDPERHRRWTGNGNEEILNNLQDAAERQQDLLIRIPLVCGLNDSAEEQESLAEIVSQLSKLRDMLTVELLPMHHLGEPKYLALGESYPMAGVMAPSAELVQEMRSRLEKIPVHVRVAAQDGGE